MQWIEPRVLLIITRLFELFKYFFYYFSRFFISNESETMCTFKLFTFLEEMHDISLKIRENTGSKGK